MSTSIITPEVINQDTSILEESPMTEGEEKELVIVKTAIASAYSNRLEQDIAIGAGLTQIFRRRLYRGKDGGRKWDDWLKEESFMAERLLSVSLRSVNRRERPFPWHSTSGFANTDKTSDWSTGNPSRGCR